MNRSIRRLGVRKLRLVAGFTLAAVFGLLLACNPVASLQGGHLYIEIGEADARLMVPGIDMTVANYTIWGDGPNGASFSETVTGASLTERGLTFGTWNIQANGTNAAGTIITNGSATATVVPGTDQVVSLSTVPVAGPGTLTLAVTWPATGVDTPSIQAQLVPNKGTPIDLAFTSPSAGRATFSDGTIPNGYYTLVVKLLDNGQLVMGAVDVVRIVKGQTTAGTVDFTQVNTGTGSIKLNITPQMNNPVKVSMSGQLAEVGTGIPLTVSASVPAGTGNTTYVWYLNGQSQSTGTSYTFNSASSPLAPGVYRLDVAAFTGGGARGGSATITFRVFATAQITLQWDPSTDASVTGYKLYTGTTSGVYGTPIDVGNVTTYTLNNLLSGHTYYFAVTAYNSAGRESVYSNELKYSTP